MYELAIVTRGVTSSSLAQIEFHGMVNSLRLWVREAIGAYPAETVSDLVYGVPGWPVAMHPIWSFVGVALYFVLKITLTHLCSRWGTNGKSKEFKRVTLVHNLCLCAYSFWTCVNVWSLTLEHLKLYGYESTVCNSRLWTGGMNFWGFLFYLSKYWELLDTFLLVWKGRQPSFLQVYHHAVTLVCAYMLQASHSTVMFLFVGLNSAIHTVMYAYYALTVLGIRTSAKSVITVLQMVQFCVGNTFAAPTLFLRSGNCTSPAQQTAVAAIMLHATFLIYLFAVFYRKTYLDPRQRKPQVSSEHYADAAKSQ